MGRNRKTQRFKSNLAENREIKRYQGALTAAKNSGGKTACYAEQDFVGYAEFNEIIRVCSNRGVYTILL